MVRTAPNKNAKGIHSWPLLTAPAKTMYLLKKPPNIGIPITDNEQAKNEIAVIGMV